MQRLRLYDLRLSDLPSLIGVCTSDVVAIANAVNRAQERLLNAKEAGDEGWFGTWAEMAFVLNTPNPPVSCSSSFFVTMPRGVSRIEYMDICGRPVQVNNQLYEYLQFGNGRLPKQFPTCRRLPQTFSRNNAVTFIDLTNTPQLIQVIITDPADAGQRVLIQGLDNNGNTIYSQDGFNQVTGQFLTLASPFATFPFQMTALTGIQKDITQGPVQFFQVDPNTGARVLILTMDPTEQTAWYRRYYLDSLPNSCCFGSVPAPTAFTVSATFLAKLELIPVVGDTDYTLIQSKEAIIQECQSIRYDALDTPAGQQMADKHHINAIRILNGQLTNYLGLDSPAVGFKPFGSARLNHQRIGSMI